MREIHTYTVKYIPYTYPLQTYTLFTKLHCKNFLIFYMQSRGGVYP